jgi:hypothetical protein
MIGIAAELIGADLLASWCLAASSAGAVCTENSILVDYVT